MQLKLTISKDIADFVNEFKDNKLNSILFLFFLFFPISLVFGPALIEITFFFSSIIFFFLIFKKKILLNHNYLNTKFIFILLFIIVCILSSLLSDNILNSFKSSFFLVRFIIYSIIIFILLKKTNYIKRFLNFNLIFISVCLIDAYIQLTLGKNIFFYDTSTDFVTGFFFDEKKLGRYLITLSPILVGVYLSINRKNINLKLINSLVFLIIVFFITLFTSERVSMFYSTVTILITVLYGIKLSKKYLLFILLPFVIFISIYNFNINNFHNTVVDSINQITDNKKSFSYPSKQHRSFMITSYKLFTDNPILGIGPNNYRHKCKDVSLKFKNNCSTHPHNIFFQILSETGLLGIIFYVWFLIILLKKIFTLIFSKNNLNSGLFFLLPIIYFINPFLPSGNFFNNWYMAIGTFGIPFYLYFNEIKINKD